MAFQIGVPAGGFSLKVKKYHNTDSGAHRIGVPAGGFSARKKRNNEPILKVIVLSNRLYCSFSYPIIPRADCRRHNRVRIRIRLG